MDFSKRMNSKEAAGYLGRSAQWLLKTGISVISHYKIGGRYYFLKEDLDAYLESTKLGQGPVSTRTKAKSDYREFSLK